MDIVILTECWISEESSAPKLVSFSSIFVNSKFGKSGGIIIYIKNNLNYSEINLNKLIIKNTSDEFLFVSLNNLKLNILVTYRHPTNEKKDFFANIKKY